MHKNRYMSFYVGRPASAKSIFMNCLTSLERSYWAIGGSSTNLGYLTICFKIGLVILLLMKLKRWIKKSTGRLNLRESGILSELKHNHNRTTQLKTWVFASANTLERLLYPLVTRFTVINVKRSKEHEFVHISIQVLEKERMNRDVAVIIAVGIGAAIFGNVLELPD